jgi:hypothetical protein
METAKGSIILAARQSLEQTLAPGEFQRVLAGMTADAHALLDSASLVPSGRYPMERVAEMLDALGRHGGASRIARLEELRGFIAIEHLNGMLRFLVRIGTVGATIALLPKAWDLFFQGKQRAGRRPQRRALRGGAEERLRRRAAERRRERLHPRGGRAGGRGLSAAAARARAPRPSARGHRARPPASVPAARACA